MIDVNLQVNRAQMATAEALMRGFPEKMPALLADALNRGIEKARTETVRQVTQAYYVKATDIRKVSQVSRATRNRLFARMTARGEVIPLYKFRVSPKRIGGRKPRGGLSVAVKKDSGTSKLPSAFIAQMKSGHTGVFTRSAKTRFPVSELFSPAVPSMIGNPEITAHIEREAAAMVERRVDHAIGLILGR